MISAQEARERELRHWATDKWEGPEHEGLDSRLVKLHNAMLFMRRLRIWQERFVGSVLELGGGQLQCSVLLKGLLPNLTVYGSDISPAAISVLPVWERMLEAKIEGSCACPSDSLPFEAESLDTVFAFEAAHHFLTHRKTLKEIHRVLRPGGTCLYIQEPVCRRWMYPLMYRLANRAARTPGGFVHEDVIVYPKLLRIAREEGFETEISLYPQLITLGRLGAVHKGFAALLPAFGRFTFSMADMMFSKPK